MRPIRSAAFAFALFAATPAAPQDAIRDDGAVMERLADGVYAIIHEDATDEWPHANVGVIVTDDGVFVIDACYLPSRAAADIRLIRRLTRKPVRYLSATHWHSDHTLGAMAYREAFPEMVVLYERHTDAFANVNAHWRPLMSTAEGSARIQANAELARRIESGVGEDGAALTPEEKSTLAKNLRNRNAEIEEMRTIRSVRADQTFDGAMDIVLGGRKIEIRDRGKANSPNDVTFYLPEEKILFAGDIVVEAPLPYTGASWPKPWIDVLADIEAEPIDILVPGHGPVMRDRAYVARLRETFTAVLARVEALALRGRTLEQIQAEIELDDLRAGYAPWNEGVTDADWKAVMGALVERSFRAVRGQG